MNILRDTSALASATNEIIGSNFKSGASVRFTIPTKSMLPTFAPGDQVLARALRAGEPRIGDIVMIRNDRSWLAHRLIDRYIVDGQTSFVTHGDYGTETDGPWSAEQVCGIITAVERRGSRFTFESARARWFGNVIARFLCLRSRTRSTLAKKLNAALVRSAAWLGYWYFK